MRLSNLSRLIMEPYYSVMATKGKSIILKKVMFEEIERGYAVIFAREDVEAKANADQLVELLNLISRDYPKVHYDLIRPAANPIASPLVAGIPNVPKICELET